MNVERSLSYQENGKQTGATIMKTNRTSGVLVGCVMLLCANDGFAQDWPQWRGPNRDAKAMALPRLRPGPRS